MAKIGQGHLQAFGRQGLKELTQALPAFPESIRPVEEPGLAGNLTPQEVVAEKGEHELVMAEYAARGREPQERQMER